MYKDMIRGDLYLSNISCPLFSQRVHHHIEGGAVLVALHRHLGQPVLVAGANAIWQPALATLGFPGKSYDQERLGLKQFPSHLKSTLYFLLSCLLFGLYILCLSWKGSQ